MIKGNFGGRLSENLILQTNHCNQLWCYHFGSLGILAYSTLSLRYVCICMAQFHKTLSQWLFFPCSWNNILVFPKILLILHKFMHLLLFPSVYNLSQGGIKYFTSWEPGFQIRYFLRNNVKSSNAKLTFVGKMVKET